jgi:type IV pilus assembly protein PilC
MLSALALVGDSVGNLVVKNVIDKASREIQEGDQISASLRKAGIFPDLLVQMVSIGEETGDLPEMFERTADYYDEELDSLVSSLSSIIEPAMMIFVGIVVGIFIMGILLPILGISAQFT